MIINNIFININLIETVKFINQKLIICTSNDTIKIDCHTLKQAINLNEILCESNIDIDLTSNLEIDIFSFDSNNKEDFESDTNLIKNAFKNRERFYKIIDKINLSIANGIINNNNHSKINLFAETLNESFKSILNLDTNLLKV